ncbi:MAG: YfcE family phosphodiesterase [Clostridia bacterium]|nr:YfcE family phosphodiesterase [Clostridia bacterium]
MKIIVFSDSHGDAVSMEEALKKHRSAEVMIFCGDGSRDIQTIRSLHPDKALFAVRGNCDWYCDFPDVLDLELCGKKIFVTHGHLFGVKQGLQRYIDHGHSNGYDIIIFGHTHKQLTSVEGNMLLLNPGAIGYGGKYAILEINENTGQITATEYPDSSMPPLKL